MEQLIDVVIMSEKIAKRPKSEIKEKDAKSHSEFLILWNGVKDKFVSILDEGESSLINKCNHARTNLSDKKIEAEPKE